MDKNNEDEPNTERKEKIKKYEHLAIRPATFAEFRRLKKDSPSDDAFILDILRAYKIQLNKKEVQDA